MRSSGTREVFAAALHNVGSMHPVSRRDIDIDGLTAHAFTSGSNDPAAATFVLIHGIGMSHRYFARLQQQLSSHGRVHSIDLPGFGATPHPEHPLSIEEYGSVLLRVLVELQVHSCTLVGHSMGTQFVVETARLAPALASGLVLMGPVVDPRRRTLVQQGLALALDGLREPPSANWYVFTDYLRCGIRWYLKVLPAMMNYRTEQAIGDVHCPVLVLRGGNDPIAGQEWCRMLARNAPGARVLSLPGHAHVVQQSAPKRVAEAVIRFARMRVPVTEAP